MAHSLNAAAVIDWPRSMSLSVAQKPQVLAASLGRDNVKNDIIPNGLMLD
jgi:hypothetical protein